MMIIIMLYDDNYNVKRWFQ